MGTISKPCARCGGPREIEDINICGSCGDDLRQEAMAYESQAERGPTPPENTGYTDDF